MEEIKTIINIQKYLLSWFINDWYIEEYEWILIPDMFWRFKKQFAFLQKNWNKITPDFMENIWWEIYLELNQNYSSDFITGRNKYIKQLIEFFYKDKLIKWELKTEQYLEIKEKFTKLDYLETSKEFEPLSYEKSLEIWYEELINTDINKTMSWGWDEFDKKLWYLMWWQLILIWWTTWTWKSTFVNQICYNVWKQWFKVARFSLEDRFEEKRKEELYYMVWRIRKQNWLKNYPWADFEANNIKTKEFETEINIAVEKLTKINKNIIDFKKSKQLKIQDLERLIENQVKNWCKLFVVDHLHYFDMWNETKDRHDLIIQWVMHKINEIARIHNITIILLAHYRKVWRFKPTNEDFKDWNSISQVANKIIHIYRDNFDDIPWFESETEFIIWKNRSPTWCWIIKWTFNVWTFEYNFEMSELQKQRQFN